MAKKMVEVDVPDEAPELVAQDGSGADIRLGDAVTMALVVTGIHGDSDKVVNLARLVGGVENHLLTCKASWVKK